MKVEGFVYIYFHIDCGLKIFLSKDLSRFPRVSVIRVIKLDVVFEEANSSRALNLNIFVCLQYTFGAFVSGGRGRELLLPYIIVKV